MQTRRHQPSRGALDLLDRSIKANLYPTKIRLNARLYNVDLDIELSAEAPEPRLVALLGATREVDIDRRSHRTLESVPMSKLNSSVRFAVPFCALAIAGCGLPNVVGKWENASLLDGKAKVVYEFLPDGTFTSSVQMNMSDTGMVMNATGRGTYTLKKDRLVTNIKDFALDGVPDSVNREVRRNLPRMGRRSISGSMQWRTPDSFVLIEDIRGTTMIFERVKK